MPALAESRKVEFVTIARPLGTPKSSIDPV